MARNKRLLRQICRHLTPADGKPPDQEAFIEAIDKTYQHHDASEKLAERALMLMSEELNLRNDELRARLEAMQHIEAEQQALIQRLEEAHNQLLQSEKLASIGQLAAGVAHEINNPVGYVSSNLSSLKGYIGQLFDLIDVCHAQMLTLPDDAPQRQAILAARKEADVDFLREDITALLGESGEGITRVRRIVQDLKDFSHADRGEWVLADLHKGLESTLNVVHNEIKYKAEVIREYGPLPMIECRPPQLNQVFMNLLVNAAHAITEHGTIHVRTGVAGEEVWVEVADTGAGIPPEIRDRIFDPFFTTKPVGKGTGLGLSISYGIVRKHSGRIEVESEPGRGTTFRVTLPIHPPHDEKEAA